MRGVSNSAYKDLSTWCALAVRLQTFAQSFVYIHSCIALKWNFLHVVRHLRCMTVLRLYYGHTYCLSSYAHIQGWGDALGRGRPHGAHAASNCIQRVIEEICWYWLAHILSIRALCCASGVLQVYRHGVMVKACFSCQSSFISSKWCFSSILSWSDPS